MQLKEYYIWIVTSYLEFCRDAADARAGAVAYIQLVEHQVCLQSYRTISKHGNIANSKRRMYGPIF